MAAPKYTTSIGLSFAALCFGVIVGTMVLVGVTLVVAIVGSLMDPDIGAGAALPFVVLFGFGFFAAGLLLFAAPCWLALHWLGFRSPRVAILLGAVLAPAAVVYWNLTDLLAVALLPIDFDALLSSYPSIQQKRAETMAVSVVMSIVGALVGWIIWKIAYFQVTDSASTPSPRS